MEFSEKKGAFKLLYRTRFNINILVQSKLALGIAFVDCVDVINIIYSWLKDYPLNEIRVQLHVREKQIHG